MKRKLLAALLALALLGAMTPAALAEESAVTGPLGADAIPTVLDTGRGYVVYYALASAIYYSPDGAAWTDLSDRSWIREASVYMGALSGQCRREFQILWTGEEYMMRQFLLDDPRTTHQVYGESPRNNKVTFLDEDFQIIGELDLGAPVEAIRWEGETYYATVGGVERAFTRQDWDRRFSDVPQDSWFAQGVDLCAQRGVMVGVGDGRFDPERALTQAECLTLALRLYDLAHGEEPTLQTAPEEDWWRDVCYTVVQRGLEEIFDPADFSAAAATRGFFAKTLAAGCGEGLEQRFQVDAIPDLPREDSAHPQADAYRGAVYALYEAGILNGVDDSGAFDAQGTLTRAQAAVMAARVLDEGQRIAVPPAGGRLCQDE